MDSASGFYNYRARNYDAHTGRFTSEDPLRWAAGDTNLSRYVGNNPGSMVDPSGMKKAPFRPSDGRPRTPEEFLTCQPELAQWTQTHQRTFQRMAEVLARPIGEGLGAGADLSTNINTQHGNLTREIEWHEVGREGVVIYTPYCNWITCGFGFGFWEYAETQAPPIRIPYDAYDPDSKELAFQLVLRWRNYDDLMQLGKDLGEAMGSAPERAIRTAFPAADLAGEIVETADNGYRCLQAGFGPGGGDWGSIAVTALKGFLHYKMWRASRQAIGPSAPKATLRSDIADHLRLRDPNVRRSKGIGGAHSLDEFNAAATIENIRITNRTPHPTQAGIEKIEYQMPALDSASNPTGGYKNTIYSKTVYDPNVISDAEMLRLGQEAANEALSRGALTREWTGTASNGMRFRGYLDDAGIVRSFFPDF